MIATRDKPTERIRMRTMAVVIAFVVAVMSAHAAPQSTGASFDSKGVQIRYVARGTGTPVVLLHGLTGSSARHFEATGIIDALVGAGYRAIAMDVRGHGESGKPHDENAYGMPMVMDVVRLLDHLDINRAHVVGYSMGGAIANQLLVKYPTRLRTVALIGAGWEGEDLDTLRSQMLTLADAFAKKDATPLLRAVTGGQNAPSDDAVAAASAALFARNDPAALAAATRGLLQLFQISEAELRAVKVPVLAVVGEEDQNAASAKSMARAVTTMEVIIIPGANHATSVRPAAAPIVAFLNKHKNANR
jgi:pimeloyl-ACP methyl ester carboxylesterase